MAYWRHSTPLKNVDMGRCALENGDAASTVIPVRKMTDLHDPAPPG